MLAYTQQMYSISILEKQTSKQRNWSCLQYFHFILTVSSQLKFLNYYVKVYFPYRDLSPHRPSQELIHTIFSILLSFDNWPLLSNCQERHRVYEYWVSTETNADEASSHLERETAELIKTIVGFSLEFESERLKPEWLFPSEIYSVKLVLLRSTTSTCPSQILRSHG